jgi:hypothetical protein
MTTTTTNWRNVTQGKIFAAGRARLELARNEPQRPPAAGLLPEVKQMLDAFAASQHVQDFRAACEELAENELAIAELVARIEDGQQEQSSDPWKSVDETVHRIDGLKVELKTAVEWRETLRPRAEKMQAALAQEYAKAAADLKLRLTSELGGQLREATARLVESISPLLDELDRLNSQHVTAMAITAPPLESIAGRLPNKANAAVREGQPTQCDPPGVGVIGGAGGIGRTVPLMVAGRR